MATAGNLVFQGQIDQLFNAYDSASGKRLWSFNAQAPVIAPPITYSAKGRQYVTVLTGMGTSGSAFGVLMRKYPVDYRTQARRVLTFAIGGRAILPKSEPFVLEPLLDPTYRPNPALADKGGAIFMQRCAVCHGSVAVAAWSAPDLRASGVPVDPEAFASIVRDGVLVPSGMPRFEELSNGELGALRQYWGASGRRRSSRRQRQRRRLHRRDDRPADPPDRLLRPRHSGGGAAPSCAVRFGALFHR